MGDKAATALFEETQRPDYRDRLGKILAAVSFFILTLLVREYIWTVVCLWLFFEPFRPMATRLTAECLRTNPGSVSCTVQLDQILRCEVVEYRTSFWHGVIAPGMVFPSQCVRVRGNRGVRLDLTDGLHLLIGSQEPERLAAAILSRKAAPAAA